MAAATVALRAALGRIGWSNQAQNAFTNEGFGAMDDIGLVTRDFLGKVCKKLRTPRDAIPAAFGAPAIPAIRPVDIPLLNEFKLYGMHLWVVEKQRQGLDIVPIEFTQEVGKEYTAKIRLIIEEKDSKTEDLVKLPDPFNKDTDWVQFKKLLVNYLGSKTGVNRAPLSYCVRDDDDVEMEDEVEFENQYERLVAMTPHSGEAFAEDNGQVWAILKQLTLKGPAFAYISQFDRTRNGRSAFKALINHYQGDSQISKAKQTAYDDLRTVEYKGERRNFTFESYVNRHTKAYRTLEEYGETVSEEKKVIDFLDHITDNSPAMVAGKAAVLSNPAFRSDFVATTNYLTNFIQSLPKSTIRTIGMVNTNKKGGPNKAKKGKAKYQGPVKVKAQNYERADWDKLTYEQREEVKRLRRVAKEQRGRTAGSTTSEPTTSENGTGSPPNAGDQFALPNKKGKQS